MPERDSAPTEVQLNLNPTAVSAALLTAVRDVSDTVALGLHALAAYQPRERPTMPTDSFPLLFHDPSLPLRTADLVALKSQHSTWLLQSGFGGFVKGISAALQEAHLFYTIAALPKRHQTTLKDLLGNVQRTKLAASKLPLPALAMKVSQHLTGQLQLLPHVLSYNDVRNCLEHRGGVVSAADVNSGDGALLMRWRSQKMVWVSNDGVEADLKLPMVLSNGTINLKINDREKAFAIGERVEISAEEFNDAVFTCFLFASDLAAKLPAVPPPSPVSPQPS